MNTLNEKSEKRESYPSDGDYQVLLVDDEERLTIPIKMVLVEEGYKVKTCKNGKEAVDYFEKSWENVDIVLLDMIMPLMNGEETFDALQKIDPQVKVLLFSGFTITEGIQNILDRGAMDFIQKPVRLKNLLAKIKEIQSSE